MVEEAGGLRCPCLTRLPPNTSPHRGTQHRSELSGIWNSGEVLAKCLPNRQPDLAINKDNVGRI